MTNCICSPLIAAATILVAGVASGAVNHQVSITNFAFTPPALTIAPGDSVTWTNTTALTLHTATDDLAQWNTGTIPAGGGKATLVFPAVAAYSYHCAFHLFMTATLRVESTVGVEDRPSVSARSWGRVKRLYREVSLP